MKRNQFWIEIVVLAAGMACAMALLLACLGAVAVVAGELKSLPEPATGAAVQPTPQTYGVQQGVQQEVQQQVQEQVQPAHPGRQRAYEGMVTCSQCGARHSAASGKTAADCSRSCVHSGSQFALVEGDKTYLLDGDVAVVNKFAGQRARVTGALSGKTIVVSSVAAAS